MRFGGTSQLLQRTVTALAKETLEAPHKSAVRGCLKIIRHGNRLRLLGVRDRQNLAVALAQLQDCYSTDTLTFFAGAVAISIRAAQRSINSPNAAFKFCR